jgi:hypothetical protein
MASLSHDFAAEIQQLQAKFGLDRGEERYLPEQFGNAYFSLIGNTISVRLLRDRGEVFLDFRLGQGDWMPADDVLRQLCIHPAPGETLSVKQAIRVLCESHRND